MQSLYYQVFDIIFFTLPEFLFITVMTYIIMKRYDLLDIYRAWDTIKNLLIPSMVGITIFIILGGLGFGSIINIISIFALYIATLFVTQKNLFSKSPIYYLKLLGSVIISSSIGFGVETICVIILITIPKIDIISILNTNLPSYNKLITGLGWMIIELMTVVILCIKKNTKFSTIISTILKNRYLSILCSTILLINITISYITVRLVLFNGILVNISLNEQIAIILGLLIILPISLILCIITIISLLINKENQIQQLYQVTDFDN